MRIGIITIDDFDNYGNRLQNYALWSFLSSMGFEVINILNDPNYSSYSLKHKIRLFFVRNYSLVGRRRKNFKIFNDKMPFERMDDRMNCDYYIVGSDQVWNPHFGRLSGTDLLTFVVPDRRISFAASFGVSQLPEEVADNVRVELEKFKAISVREVQGKKIIENLGIKTKVSVFLDPTMLITSTQWSKVATAPRATISGKYILCYFLGDISEERKCIIEDFAKRINCEVIYILDRKSAFYESGPSEFLYLEEHADMILTDSFHAAVFSIIFQRPFLVFRREQEDIEDMSSRIDTLLDAMHLENCVFTGNILDKNLNVDFSASHQVIADNYRECVNFCKENLA